MISQRGALAARLPAAMRRAMQPCIALGRVHDLARGGRTRFGGHPELAPGTPWPTVDARNPATGGARLPLFCQLDFEELAPFDLGALLPRTGLLSCFCHFDDEESDPPAACLFQDLPALGAVTQDGASVLEERVVRAGEGVVFVGEGGERGRFDEITGEAPFHVACGELGIGTLATILGEFFFFRSELREAYGGKYRSLLRVVPADLGGEWQRFGDAVVHIAIKPADLQQRHFERAVLLLEAGT